MRPALALAAALLSSAWAAAPNSLTVWVPERGQTATLSAAGLKGEDGSRVPLDLGRFWGQESLERPLPGGYVRLVYATKSSPTRLEVVQGGKVTASRALPEARSTNGFWGTQRGPCLGLQGSSSDGVIVRCFSPDLKSEWAKVPGQVLNVHVSADGRAAYTVMTDWKLQQPYTETVRIIRHDLLSGKQTPLSYRVPRDDQDAEYHRNLASAYDARETVRFAAELPGERFLICATMTMPKLGCRLDVIDRDARKLFSLQGDAWVFLPQATADGQKLYSMGNTLQVWDARTGKRLASIHDPLWDKLQQSPLNAYLTPDGTQAAIVTHGLQPGSGAPDMNSLTAFLYRLSDGQRLSRFALKP